MPFIPLNLNGVEPATGFNYDPGVYMMEIARHEEKTNQNGSTKRLVVHNKIMMGPGTSEKFKNSPLISSYQLTDAGARFLMRLIVACDLKPWVDQSQGQFDPDWLLGKRYVCRVIMKDGYPNITDERPVSEWQEALQAAAAKGGTTQQPTLLTPAAAPPTAPPAVAAPPYAAPPVAAPPVMAAPTMPAMAPAPGVATMPAPVAAPAGIPAPVPPPGTVGGNSQ